MRIAIVGSRDYPDLEAVRAFVAGLDADTEVVSGGARGVDRTAATAAQKRGLKVTEIPALWSQHGKRAGLIRNQEIVAYCDILVAFWDGSSKGTAHDIAIARRAGKLGEIVSPP